MRAMPRTTLPAHFDQYYTYDQMTAWLKKAVRLYPKLCRLTSIGESYGGKTMWLLEITDTRKGDFADKPAYYIEANIHAGEVCGEVVCRWLIWHLLTRQGSDRSVKGLLAERSFYVLPRITVDGADVCLTSPEWLRSSVRPYPYEEEQPGLREEDIDGDGEIMTMRLEDPCGSWKVSDLDDRIMVKRAPDEDGGTYYRLLPEGRLYDWDGHGIPLAPPRWGLDLNRNWPHDWAVEGEQSGGGPMPLSEPETRAVADFIVSHPNICGVQSLHLTSGAILRPYCAKDDESFPTPDLEIYRAIGKRGTEITGYPCVSIYHDFRYEPKKFIRGGFLDWIYEDLGIFSFSTELWDAFKTAGIEERDMIKFLMYERKPDDELKLLEWSDRELDGAGFRPWKPFDHPQLGKVEIGGWDFWAVWGSPPPKFREEIARQNAEFAIAHARMSPLVRIDDAEAERLAKGVYRVSCTVRNYGFLSTAISTKAVQRNLVRPLRIEISVPQGCRLAGGKPRLDIGHLEGRSNKLRARFGGAEPTDNERYVEWVVEAPAGKRVTITVTGQRTGRQRRSVKLPE
jgi:murein tripeptide amidase MpaA